MSDKNTGSGLEFLESPEGLAGEINKIEKSLEKNRNIFYIVGGAILGILAIWFGYRYYVSSQDEEAQAALYSAVFAVEADSLNKALKGSGGSQGLTAIADDFGATPAGNLASYYAGAALLKQGKFDEAIERLKAFSSSDLLVQARAYSLIGDAYMEKNSTEDAIGYYQKAVDYKPNAYFTPTYMMKLGIAYEKAKKNTEAMEVYGELIEKYPQSSETLNAKKFKALLEAAAE
ncbi:MAG: tetratricopeptide repeat protein [Spirosomaceae bacterium]|jgi:TolA-binding protein|nr:tetratricopeptide repeat protein [Spirosomataceae bacterium]